MRYPERLPMGRCVLNCEMVSVAASLSLPQYRSDDWEAPAKQVSPNQLSWKVYKGLGQRGRGKLRASSRRAEGVRERLSLVERSGVDFRVSPGF